MERRTGFQCPSPPSSLWTAAHAEAFPVHGVSSHWREGPWDIDMSEVTRSRVRPQIPGRGHQIQSEATRSRARPPDPERGHQIQSEATRSRVRPPDPERDHQIQSEARVCNNGGSGVWRFFVFTKAHFAKPSFRCRLPWYY